VREGGSIPGKAAFEVDNDAFAPFGGVGASGNGTRFGSQSSWDEFTSWQWVTSRAKAHGFPF
jgi:benzaldehyde dehydrogenase (NAD)